MRWKGGFTIEKSPFICQIKALLVYSRNNQVDAQKDVKTQDYPQRPGIKGGKCQKHTFVASVATSTRICPFNVHIFTLVTLLLLNLGGQMQGDLWMVGQWSQKYQERQACAYTSNHHWTPLRIEAKHAHYEALVFLPHLLSNWLRRKPFWKIGLACCQIEEASRGLELALLHISDVFWQSIFFIYLVRYIHLPSCQSNSAVPKMQLRFFFKKSNSFLFFADLRKIYFTGYCKIFEMIFLRVRLSSWFYNTNYK